MKRTLAALVGVAALGATAGVASAATTVVTEDDIGSSWQPNVVGDDSDLSISGDVGAPTGLGDAALRLVTENNNDARAELGTQVDVALSDVDDLSYWTYQEAGSENAAVAYKLYVTFDGGWTFLVHEPYWQNGGGDPDPVDSGTWQPWTDIEDGNWWSSKSSTVNGSTGLEAGAGGPPFYSLADVLDLHPDAQVEAVQVGIGSYNPGWTVFTDGVTFDGITYDFEPVPPTKDDCKQGGWTDSDLHGQEFRNQGQCVSSYASNGKGGGPKN